MNKKVLVVDDEPSLRAGLELLLRGAGYEVATAGDAADAEQRLLGQEFDLVLLDVMLPDRPGTELLRDIRVRGLRLPVILLTARAEEEDKIEGLDLGADDYLTKPFSNGELLARVRAHLRRHEAVADGKRVSKVRASGYEFDFLENTVIVPGGQQKGLTSREVGVLKRLIDNHQRAVSRAELLKEVWGYPDGNIETRTVENCILRLRQKIERDPRRPVIVETVHGEGYRFAAKIESAG